MTAEIVQRVNKLKMKAALRYNIGPEKCHIGFLALEGFLERPEAIHQIDGATGTEETNQSIATRTMRLANAMDKYGLQPGDPVILMGPNHLDLAVPYYACHFMGYSMCAIDPAVQPGDLLLLYPNIKPKVIFCQKECVEKNEKALQINCIEAKIVTFDDKSNDLEVFTEMYKGTEDNFRPALFDTANTPAWFILTSGTTGAPKVAIIPFDTLLNGVIEWWKNVEESVNMMMIMTSTQWLSALIFYIGTSIKGHIRLQSSLPISPQILVHMINKYRPESTAWTPFLLARFVQTPSKVCDLSCFKHILVGGGAVEKHIIDAFKKICNARLYLCYGMTELLVGIFDYKEDTTPFGSSGKGMSKYQFRLVDNKGQDVLEPNKKGELWVKGDAFFKGYLNNIEETRKMLTEDGWLKTGDIFYRDENDYYYFAERKKLLIRYQTTWVSPLQVEEVIKRHPDVSEACVVGLPNPSTFELPVAAVMKKGGGNLDPQEIFDLVNEALPEDKRLHGGIFFVDSFPTTPSGKVNRSELLEIAKDTPKLMAN